MDVTEFSLDQIPGIIRDLEEAVENANLLALELALKALEDDRAVADTEGLGELIGSAATATGEFERLVRRLKAA